ncbi:Extracellular ligand-binding receptor [Pseudodesulfovibrio piezophilus C1TLV30]|uniref:Extracellular ligand-binding receptor n=2 Tax=Pseudodesulfovibrio TaxID=2035811 RepID=M1WM89_PSEP2|nr:Extracellular ligand-binding receptor [Pseudodesulfovibrio piezophilus C1TLV30]
MAKTIALLFHEWHWISVSKYCEGTIWATVMFLVALVTLPVRTACAEQPKELVFGMSAPFTGTNGEMGVEFYRGIMAYLDHLNATGGAGGWTLRVLPCNDGYNPGPCFENTSDFIRSKDVFALFSYLGTPTTTHILPLLQKFDEHQTYMLFPLTGAQPMRTEPFRKYVYNLRASYFEETAGLVKNLTEIGRDRIAVFYQSDAYGRTGWDGVRRALLLQGLHIVSEAAYQRGANFDSDFVRESRLLLAGTPDAVICIGTYGAQAALIRDLRDMGSDIPVAGVSFAESGKMLELLTKAGMEHGKDYTRNLINTQVVPSYEAVELPGVRLYRTLMDAYKGAASVSGSTYTPRRFSYVSFEGFLNGVLLGEMVSRMADAPSRERIPDVMNSIHDFDMGIGVPVDFSDGKHQGLHAVYYTTVVNDRFLPIDDWQRWRK